MELHEKLAATLAELSDEDRAEVEELAQADAARLPYGSLTSVTVVAQVAVWGQQQVDGHPIDHLMLQYQLMNHGPLARRWLVVSAQAWAEDPTMPGSGKAIVLGEWTGADEDPHGPIPGWVRELADANLPKIVRIGHLSMFEPNALVELMDDLDEVTV